MNNTGQDGGGGGNLHRGLFMAARFYYESHFYSFCLYSCVFCFPTLFLLSGTLSFSAGVCPMFRTSILHYKLQFLSQLSSV